MKSTMTTTRPAAERAIHAVQTTPAPTAEGQGFKRETFYANDEDRAARERVREKFGLSSGSDAVRLALRILAGDSIVWKLEEKPTRRITVKFRSRS